MVSLLLGTKNYEPCDRVPLANYPEGIGVKVVTSDKNGYAGKPAPFYKLHPTGLSAHALRTATDSGSVIIKGAEEDMHKCRRHGAPPCRNPTRIGW